MAVSSIAVLVFSIVAVRIVSLMQEVRVLERHADVLTHALEGKAGELQEVQVTMVARNEELQGHKDLIQSLRQQLGIIDDQSQQLQQLRTMVESATAVTGTLKKLSETDKELLAKYSRVFFLNEHYEPSDLVALDTKWKSNGNGIYVKAEVQPFLQEMLSVMEHEGLNPRIVSAYRSFDYQSTLKAAYKRAYGSGANTFSADQGYSEHQLGTTIDIEQQGKGLTGFEKTPEYQWLREHAHIYGFTLSYPEDNEYYTFEPWHWRFVGKALAGELYAQNQYFYDKDQREIDTHLIDLFDK